MNEKAKVMQWHYNQLGQDAPFMLRASGRFEWREGHSEPEPDVLVKWKVDYDKWKLLQPLKETLLKLIKNNEYHLISRRFADDRQEWETKLDKWAAQLEEVKAGNIVEIEPAPVFS